MVKFRTMVEGADRLRTGLEGRNEAEGALFDPRRPRVTRSARYSAALARRAAAGAERAARRDEPRRPAAAAAPRLPPARGLAPRNLVLPGITGLWQISGRSNLSFDDLVRLDFYYLENWSIWLDIGVLVKTMAVLGRRGAY